jgi:hypothetical protein
MSAEDRPFEGQSPLADALIAVRKSTQRRQPLTRHDARTVLLALGAELAAGRAAEVDAAIATLHEILPTAAAPDSGDWGERWRAAVADELSMACTEFVRAVDPRYLRHARYDFEYTIQARERLELRLRAAQRMGLPVGEAWRAQVARADEELAAALRRARPGGAR